MTSRITLGPPLVGAPAPTDAPLSVAYGERHGEGARQVAVLAVTADAETAGLFHQVLSRDRLLVAGDPAEAIALAEAEAPQIVFIDVEVADGAGLALVHHVKVVAPGATVFALASASGVASGAHAVALGAAGLFILPLGGDEILNAVHAVRARLVERAARGQILSELRAHTRAAGWLRRMAELVDAPDWEAVAGEVADVLAEATEAAGAAVYVARDERDGEFAQRSAPAALAGAPLFGTEAELIEHARREQLTVVRLGVRKQTVGFALLLAEEPDEEAVSGPASSLATALHGATMLRERASSRGPRSGPGSGEGGRASMPGVPPVAMPPSLDGIVRLLASQAATVFALRIERERAEAAALMKDPASSAYSFAYYVDVAGREIDRARRYGRRFSIATVVLGRAAAVLEDSVPPTERGGEVRPRAAEVGDKLLSSVSDIDVVARVDEDEFHLLLPETDGLGAHAVRRRILARLAGGDRRPAPRGVLVGVATFPHDGRDLAQLLRVARRRADRSAASLVHALPGPDVGLAELCDVRVPDVGTAASDLFAARRFSLSQADAAALATTAVTEALRGGPVLVVVTAHAGLSVGPAVRALLGSGREGVTLHAIDTASAGAAAIAARESSALRAIPAGGLESISSRPGMGHGDAAPLREVEAVAVFAEHASFAMVGRADHGRVRGCHAADPLFADLVAERIGRAGGVRVLG